MAMVMAAFLAVIVAVASAPRTALVSAAQRLHQRIRERHHGVFNALRRRVGRRLVDRAACIDCGRAGCGCGCRRRRATGGERADRWQRCGSPPLASGVAGCAGFWVRPNSRRADNIASYNTLRRAWPWPSQLELDGATGSLAAAETGATGVDVDGALTMLKNVSETEEMDMTYSKLMTAARSTRPHRCSVVGQGRPQVQADRETTCNVPTEPGLWVTPPIAVTPKRPGVAPKRCIATVQARSGLPSGATITSQASTLRRPPVQLLQTRREPSLQPIRRDHPRRRHGRCVAGRRARAAPTGAGD